MLTCSMLLVSMVFRFWQRAIRAVALSAVVLCMACGAAITAAQTIQFDGAQRPVATGFYEPEGVAVDQYGNLFVADADTFWISEILAVNGQIPPNPTVRQLYRDTFSNPMKIAVDLQGNVYFTDLDTNNNFQNNTVKELLAVNGSIPDSPTVVQLGSGLYYPGGIAVDASGNLFVADTYHNLVKEFVAVNGTVPPSPLIKTVGSGFSGPQALAIDSTGNLYVADRNNHAVKEILAVGGAIPDSPTIVTLSSNFCSPDGLSIDSAGSVYVSDRCNALYQILAVSGSIPASPIVKTIAAGAGVSGVTDVAVDRNENVYVGGVFSANQIPQVYSSDFGSVPVGTSAGAIPLMFTFIGSTTLGSVSVVTQGGGNSEFADAGTGTCAGGVTYDSPSSYSLCTAYITFSPKSAGLRSGAVILKDPNGKTIATGYLHGTGSAPLVNFAPPSLSTVVSNLPWNQGIALDGAGNLYLSMPNQNQILKETFSNGSYASSVIPTSQLSGPIGVAVDAAGSIFIADTGNGRVLRETPSQSGYLESAVATNLSAPMGVAVDGDGIVYVICQNGTLLIETPYYQGYTNSNTITTGLPSASGVAVDGSGNVFIVSNTTNGVVLKETRSGNTYAPTSIPLPSGGMPTGIAVGVSGDLYISYVMTGGQASQVLKVTADGNFQTAVVSSGLNQPFALAADQHNNLFVADSGNYRILKVDSFEAPSVSFASTAFNATSSDSPQAITVENAGNADLTFPILPSGNNPGITANFVLDENAPSACPVIASGASAPGSLIAGSSCVLPISFAPAAVGNLSGSLVLTDNNLNAAAPGYSIQSILLDGTATQATPVITWSAPAPITYGTALTSTQLDATANVPGTFSYSPAAGSVLTAGTLTLHVTFTPADTTDYTTATSSVLLTVNKAAPVITWATPAPIASGTPLSSAQLNATANVPGTFAYAPAAGTILPAGSNTLNVTFTPTDTTDYTTAGGSVTLVVNPASFTLTASPNALAVKQGGKASTAIAIASSGGFTGSVTLSISGLPKGVTAAFSKNPTQTGSTITFTATNGATLGTSVVTITGTSGSLHQSTPIKLTVAHK